MIRNHFFCTSSRNDEVYLFEIKWNVQKNIFQSLLNTYARQSSSCFQTEFYNSSWHIELQSKPEYPKHFSLFLKLDKANVSLSYDFCYRLTSGDKELTKFTAFNSEMCDGIGSSWGWNEWEGKDDLMKASNWPTDFLTINLKIKVNKTKIETSTTDLIALSPNLENEPISQDYASLALSGLYSDVKLVIGEKKFPCHKAILSLRCEHFAKMFGSSFKEATDSIVEIADIEADDFECLLHFIYSGKYPDASASSKPSLLIAADRFGLMSVAQRCEDYLGQNINIDNCIALFEVADLCSRSNLMSKVKEFMKINIEEIIETDNWKSLKVQNPTQSLGIVESIFKKQETQ